MTENGVSTCTAGEMYEKYRTKVGRKVCMMYQYDFRDIASGELFSCVKSTLDECRAARDKWLTAKRRRVVEGYARKKEGNR